MKKIKHTLLVLILGSVGSANAQYFDSTQIANFNTARTAAEGDLYLDTLKRDYYIGLSSGRLVRINDAISDVRFTDDSLVISQGDSLFSVRIKNGEWNDGDSIALSGLVYAKQALTNGDTVVITDDGRIGVGVSNPTESIVTSGDIRANGSYFIPQIMFQTTSGTGQTGAGWQTMQSFTVPGGTLGASNAIRIIAYVRRTAGNGSAAFRLNYGGTSVVAMGNNANNPARIEFILFNTTSTSNQRAFIDHANSGNTGTDTGTGAVNSLLDQILSVQVELNTDADVWVCEYLMAELIKP